jgi:hypothetical protein
MTAFAQNGRNDRDGFALVTTLLIVLVLGVLAMGAAWIASAEKKTSFAEGVHISSVMSADAGGEACINFLRLADTAPQPDVNNDNVVRTQSHTVVRDDQGFAYTCRFLDRNLKAGWDINYMDYNYEISSTGNASIEGNSTVDLVAGRLFKEGY